MSRTSKDLTCTGLCTATWPPFLLPAGDLQRSPGPACVGRSARYMGRMAEGRSRSTGCCSTYVGDTVPGEAHGHNTASFVAASSFRRDRPCADKGPNQGSHPSTLLIWRPTTPPSDRGGGERGPRRRRVSRPPGGPRGPAGQKNCCLVDAGSVDPTHPVLRVDGHWIGITRIGSRR